MRDFRYPFPVDRCPWATPDRSASRLAHGQRSAGFSLLEVIVATAVMALAVVGTLSLTTQSLSNAVQVRQYDRAAMLARTQMSVLQTAFPLPLNRKLAGEFDEQWGWEAVATPVEFGPGGRGRSLLARIVLKIDWKDNGQDRSIEMEGFRRMKITPEMGDLSMASDPARLF